MENHTKYSRNVIPGIEESLSKIAAKVTENTLVLDVGCSSGMMGRYLALEKGCIVDGIDIDEIALENCKPVYRKIAIKNLELDDLTDVFVKESYDFIILADVIEHLNDPSRLLAQLKILVKPYGTIIFSVPNITHIAASLELLLGNFDYRQTGLLDSTHIRFYSYKNLVAKLINSGLYIWEADVVHKDLNKTEFGNEQSKLFPQKWLDTLIAVRPDSLVYQWIVATKIYPRLDQVESHPATKIITATPVFTTALYWEGSAGAGFNETNKLVGIKTGEIENELTIDFNFQPLPGQKISKIRIDPVSEKKLVWIKSAKISNGQNVTLWEWTGKEGHSDLISAKWVDTPINNGKILSAESDDPQWYPEIPEETLQKITSGTKCSIVMCDDGIFIGSVLTDALFIQKLTANQEAAERDGQIASLNQALTERDGQIASLNQALTERDGQIASLNHALTERDGQIASLNQALTERDGQIASLNHALTERDGQIASLNQSVAERDGLIAALYNSTSWRITRPLRIFAHQMKRVRRVVELAKPPIKRGGGLKNTFRKALQLYRREGLAGIRRSFRIVATSGQTIPTPGPGKYDRNDYAEWICRYDTLTDESRATMRKRIEGFAHQPRISVVMPTYNPNTVWLIEAIESVRKQIYQHWELCIADDASTDIAIRPILERYAKEDSRIKVVFREKNGHISAASNSALEIATGEWIALLDHDDLLSEHALFWVADTINSHPQSRLIYSDEDKVDERGNRSMPFFKPSWSPHLMISQAYLGHLVCYQKTLIETVGGFNTKLNGAQDYGLALACVTNIEAAQVQHIPRILYHWRMHAASTAQTGNAKPYAHEAGRKAVEIYIQNNFPGLGMRAVDGDYLFTYKAEFELPANLLASIIIPTKDGLDYLKPCVESIFDRSTWQNVEVLILDNGSEKTETIQYLKELQQREPRVQVIPAPIPFNWSKLNNIGAKYATGNVLIFLNNDTQVITPSWIESMAGYARLPNVGTVGALLLFEDGSIQHSGVVVGMSGWADHVFRTIPAQHSGGPFVSPVLTRNVLAVTGACVAISRKRFEALGGFDESFIICGSDVELGLRAHKQGLFNVMCADAKLFHYESKTRTPHVPPEDFIQSTEKYAPYRQEITDPYYNPNLSLTSTIPNIQGAPRAS